MIIGQFHVVSNAIFPAETYSVLIIHTHAVLSGPMSFQRFQVVAIRNAQIIQSPCRMQYPKPPQSNPSNSGPTA